MQKVVVNRVYVVKGVGVGFLKGGRKLGEGLVRRVGGGLGA